MKKTLLLISIALLTMPAWGQQYEIDTDKLSQYDQNAPFGWGKDVTGGTGGSQVVVDSYSALVGQLSNFNTTNKIIYVKGTITFDGAKEIHGVQNKTIIGLPGATLQNLNEDKPAANTEEAKKAAIEKTGILYFKNCNNIIIRNLTFKSAGACDFNANDNLWLDNSTNFWVDHCDFQDGVDGNFDIVLASDKVCVTWCRFRYFKEPRPAGYGGSSNDHRFTNLIGNSDSRTSDIGKLNTSFANCWWDNGCKERMPRVRFGKVHLLNCLYSSDITMNSGYNIGMGYKSNVYVENCAFISQKTPWKQQGQNDYNYTFANCQGYSGEAQARTGTSDYFVPSSNYTYDNFKYDASLVQTVVSNTVNGAGPTLIIKDATGISTLYTKSTPIVCEYFNAAGQRVGADAKGLVIMKQRMADGTIKTLKTTRK